MHLRRGVNIPRRKKARAMIHWMSEKVSDAIDTHRDADGNWFPLSCAVCETRSGKMAGHVVVQVELSDDFSTQIDLGDCRGLADEAICRRFVEEFPKVAAACRESEGSNDTFAEWLDGLAAAMAEG